MGGAFDCTMESNIPLDVVGVDDARYLQSSLLSYARRHAAELSASELERLDCELREKHMLIKAALMFDFEFANTDDVERQLSLKFDCLSRLTRILHSHNAAVVEDVLYLFDRPADAVLAALACRTEVDERKRQAGVAEPAVCIKGYGIHVGELLFVEGTDIHWGDPVNTASKMGQDHAHDGQVLISQETLEACQDDPRLKGLQFHQISLRLSGVQFQVYMVSNEATEVVRASLGSPADYRSILLEKFQQSGMVKDTAIECEKLLRLLKALDPQFAETDFDAIVNHIGRLSAADISLPAFIDWVLDAQVRRQQPWFVEAGV